MFRSVCYWPITGYYTKLTPLLLRTVHTERPIYGVVTEQAQRRWAASRTGCCRCISTLPGKSFRPVTKLERNTYVSPGQPVLNIEHTCVRELGVVVFFIQTSKTTLWSLMWIFFSSLSQSQASQAVPLDEQPNGRAYFGERRD